MKKQSRKSSLFIWEGKSKTGQLLRGELYGQSTALIKAQLRKKDIIPLNVKKKSFAVFRNGKSINNKDITSFTRQLAVMIKAGIPLLQSLDVIAEGFSKPKMRHLIFQIKEDITTGNTLTKALSRHPNYFDDLYCGLIHAGEQAGSLEILLERIAAYKEKTEELKSTVQKAISYPIVVIVVAVIISSILLIKVVPQFESIFLDFNADLPILTRMIIQLSDFLQNWWLCIAGILLIALILVARLYRQSSKVQEKIDIIILKLPIVGSISYKSSIARFSRTLSTTFSAGVPLVDALKAVAEASSNSLFKNAINNIQKEVSAGVMLHTSMRNTGAFTKLSIQMTAIGEESGTLEEMLNRVAGIYEQDVDNLIDSLTRLMEPLIMTILGILIGGLIIAMYLPIFQLGQVI
ncbi:UNVERIFIED_CONTAM: hypothetical protein GTU68_052102 [Idotea baltica]|nr:hypothetical protein [Idotea baltica]